MKFAVVGPTYPFRGGIAHYSTFLVRHLRAAGHITKFYSFTRQYPRWLFPGKTDRDPSRTPIKVDCEYVLDPINPLSWWRLCRKVAAEAPDLLILQWWVPYWTPCLTAISLFIKRRTNIPIVFICHNVVPHEGGGALDRRLALTVLRHGDAFIVHSEQDRHRLQALLPGTFILKAQLPTYVELTHQTLRPSHDDLRRSLGLPDGVPVLLFFGFVRPYKGLEYLIQALRIVRKERDARVLVVGEFWTSLEYYQHFAHEFGVEDSIVWVDRYVPDEDLGAYFGLASVVVLPYVSATQSAVVQLAFGFGKPVITTRVGGLQEVVKDGHNGLVVPPQDEEALAAAILRFLDESLGPSFSANIITDRETGSFSWQAMVRTFEEVQHHLYASIPTGTS